MATFDEMWGEDEALEPLSFDSLWDETTPTDAVTEIEQPPIEQLPIEQTPAPGTFGEALADETMPMATPQVPSLSGNVLDPQQVDPAIIPQNQIAPRDPKEFDLVGGATQAAKGIYGAAVYGLPEILARSLEESNPREKVDWKDTLINRSDAYFEEIGPSDEASGKLIFPPVPGLFPNGISLNDVHQATQSAAYSGAGMVGGLAGRALTGGAGPQAAAGAIAGSSAVLTPIALNSIRRQLLDKLDKETQKELGRAATVEEVGALLNDMQASIAIHAAGEVLPEAMTTALELGFLGKIMKGKGGVGSKVVESLKSFATEMIGETTTTQVQQPEEVKMGLRDEKPREYFNPKDIITSAQEVAPAVALMQGGMSGGASVLSSIKSKVSPQKPSEQEQATQAPTPKPQNVKDEVKARLDNMVGEDQTKEEIIDTLEKVRDSIKDGEEVPGIDQETLQEIKKQADERIQEYTAEPKPAPTVGQEGEQAQVVEQTQEVAPEPGPTKSEQIIQERFDKSKPYRDAREKVAVEDEQVRAEDKRTDEFLAGTKAEFTDKEQLGPEFRAQEAKVKAEFEAKKVKAQKAADKNKKIVSVQEAKYNSLKEIPKKNLKKNDRAFIKTYEKRQADIAKFEEEYDKTIEIPTVFEEKFKAKESAKKVDIDEEQLGPEWRAQEAKVKAEFASKKAQAKKVAARNKKVISLQEAKYNRLKEISNRKLKKDERAFVKAYETRQADIAEFEEEYNKAPELPPAVKQEFRDDKTAAKNEMTKKTDQKTETSREASDTTGKAADALKETQGSSEKESQAEKTKKTQSFAEKLGIKPKPEQDTPQGDRIGEYDKKDAEWHGLETENRAGLLKIAKQVDLKYTIGEKGLTHGVLVHDILKKLNDGGKPEYLTGDEADSPAFKKSKGNIKKGLSHQEVQVELNKTTKNWTKKPTIVDNINKLPKNLRNDIIKRGGVSTVQGLYDPKTGSVYLIANNISKGDSIARIITHEIVGHHGFEGVVEAGGMTMSEISDDVKRLKKVKNRQITEASKAVSKLYKTGELSALQESKEIIAHMAENSVDHSLMRKIVAAFKKGIRALTGNRLGKISDTDILDMIVQAQERVKGIENVTQGISNLPLAPAYSKKESISNYIVKELEETGTLKPATQTKTDVKDMFDMESNTLAGSLRKTIDNVSNAWKGRKQSLFDRYASIEKIAGKEAYTLHRLLGNTENIIAAFLTHGKLRLEGKALHPLKDDQRNEGLVPMMQKHLGKDANNFFMWQAGERAKDLEAEGRENWLLKDERKAIDEHIYKGLNDQRKKDLKAKFKAFRPIFQGFNKNILDIATEAGIIDPEARKTWESDNYIPFYRMIQSGSDEFLKSPRMGRKNIDAKIKQLKGGKAQIGNLMQNVLTNWSHLITESQRNIARTKAIEVAQLIGDVVTPIGKKKADLSSDQRKDQMLSVRDNGKVRTYVINDPGLFNALAEIQTEQFNNFLFKAIRGSKRMLTHAVTFSGAFRVANFMRDAMSTAIIEKDYSVIDSFKGFMKAWRQDTDYIKLTSSGGGFAKGYISGTDPESQAKFITKIVAKEGKGAESRILDTAAKALNFWDRIGEASEMAARVQLYSKLTKGKDKVSHAEASFRSKDLLDFGLTGESNSVRAIMQMLPFFNARVQGLYKLQRGASADKKGFFWRGVMLGMASLGLQGLNMALHPDDWDELEDWDKRTYYHFWIGEHHFRVPKPFEVGAIFSSAPEAAFDTAFGGKDMEYLSGFIGHTISETFAANPVPQILRPAAEAAANYSFFTGREIEGPGTKRLPPGERARPWTSSTLKAIGKKTGMSPQKMEHLILGYFSNFGYMALLGTDFMFDLFSDDPEKPTPPAKQWPVVGRFYRGDKEPGGTAYTKLFYDLKTEVGETSALLNKYKKLGKYKEAIELQKDKQKLLRYKGQLNKSAAVISGLNSEMNAMFADKTMSSEQKADKRDEINKRKNAIFKKAYKATR